MVYAKRVGVNIPSSGPAALRGSTGDIHTKWLVMNPSQHRTPEGVLCANRALYRRATQAKGAGRVITK